MYGKVSKTAILPIIDEATFNLAQGRIKNNRTKPDKHTARLNCLLSPKVFCGECGKMMIADGVNKPNGKIYRYYKCVNNRRKQACELRGINKDALGTSSLRTSWKFFMIQGDKRNGFKTICISE